MCAATFQADVSRMAIPFQADGRMHGQTARLTDDRSDGRADGWTDGRVDGRADGCTDGRTGRRVRRHWVWCGAHRGTHMAVSGRAIQQRFASDSGAIRFPRSDSARLAYGFWSDSSATTPPLYNIKTHLSMVSGPRGKGGGKTRPRGKGGRETREFRILPNLSVLSDSRILPDAKLEPSSQTYRSAAMASLPGPPVSLHFNLGGGDTVFRTYLGVGAGTDSRHKGSVHGRSTLN